MCEQASLFIAGKPPHQQAFEHPAIHADPYEHASHPAQVTMATVCTRARTHALSHCLTHPPTLSHKITVTHALALSHTRMHTHMHTHAHTHTHTRSLFLSHTRTLESIPSCALRSINCARHCCICIYICICICMYVYIYIYTFPLAHSAAASVALAAACLLSPERVLYRMCSATQV